MLVTYKQWQTEEIKRLNGYRADNGYVFATEKGEPLNPGTVASWLERVERKTACRICTHTHFATVWHLHCLGGMLTR